MIPLSILNPKILVGSIRHIAFRGKAVDMITGMNSDDFSDYLRSVSWDWIEADGVLFIIDVCDNGIKLRCNGT